MPTRLLLVISSEPEGPSVRHRWRTFAADLERVGIVLQVADWPKERRGREATLVRASGADGVVLSRRLLSRRWAERLRHRARRLLYDVDDAMPYRDSSRGASLSRTRARRFARLVTLSDLVIVGNAHLAGLVPSPPRPAVLVPTVLVPTVVDVPPEAAPMPSAKDGVVVGWIGSRATLPYLEAEAATLVAVAARGQRVRLRVVADRAPMLPPGMALEYVPWSAAGEARAVAGMHLGFAPLRDDAWTRGKCGFKVVQLLGAGRPVVASPVGVQADQVRPDVTGYLGATSTQLAQGLMRLVEDEGLRARMGAAAREDARARWSRQAWAPRLLAHLEGWLA